MNRFLRNYAVAGFLTLIISFFSVTAALATHLRAGEITVKRISATSLTYRVTLTTYTDQIGGIAANEAANTYKIFFGYNNIYYDVQRRKKILINPATMCNVYDTVFTYPAQGTYKITCGIQNRNANTVNLPPPTDQISFFVETTIVVAGALGLNRSPVLLNIPIDSAGVGKRFVHNPGAFDADGDSLAYILTTCKRDVGTSGETGIGEFITGYRDPASLGTPPLLNQDGTGPATFTINAITGDLVWDAPRQVGQYNAAFIVEEWRKGLDGSYIRIGAITRDMQIIVVSTPNNPPQLTLPPNVCVEAGKNVNFKVTATDKDNNNVKITTNSGVYNQDASGNKQDFIPVEAATFTPINATQKSPAQGTFNWNTNCNHVRQQPYDVLFKVEDFPGRLSVQLVDIKTIKITVVAPRPQALSVKNVTAGNVLTWQKYPNCTAKTAEIIVYRKEGCTNFQPSDCVLGLPAALGYKEIGRVSTGDTTFTDKTAVSGTIYSYRIVASLAENDFVSNLSVTSNEACIGSVIPQTLPLITNVTVDQTGTTDGQITVKWTRPQNFDSTNFKAPFQYRLSRATAIDGTDFTQIATFSKLTDTVFVDKNLNTTQNAYRYKLAFDYTDNTTKVLKTAGETAAASSVRLTATSAARQVQLNWQALVPWSNENQTHSIYREVRGKPGVFNKIAEVTVQSPNTFAYTDNGTDRFTGDGNNTIVLSTDSTYCYKVETVGTYDSKFKLGLLHNFSQISCASPVDTTRPCPPVLTLDPLDCKTLDRKQFCDPSFFKNILKWQSPASSISGQVCRKDVAQYKIYYARSKDDKFQALGSVDKSVLTYTHQRNQQEGFVGCYYVTAINPLGSESSPSNVVCKDNCPLIEFPNVFTPNGDDKNDVFSPLDCPAFTLVISFEVYNRDGIKVFESSSPTLAWDGKSSGGAELPTGTYFYVAKVQFVRLDKTSTETTTIKGMVQLIR